MPRNSFRSSPEGVRQWLPGLLFAWARARPSPFPLFLPRRLLLWRCLPPLAAAAPSVVPSRAVPSSVPSAERRVAVLANELETRSNAIVAMDSLPVALTKQGRIAAETRGRTTRILPIHRPDQTRRGRIVNSA